MPEEEAVVIDPDGNRVDLGTLTPDERRRLEAELDNARVPVGAPPAGFGGASTSNGPSGDWIAAGAGFLVLSGLASVAFWRRRHAAHTD